MTSGSAGVSGRRDMGAEHPHRDLARRVIVMVVEARLADADAFGVAGKLGELLHRNVRLLGGLMRVGADREEHVVELLGDAARPVGAGDAGRDGDHPANTSRPRPFDDPRQVLRKIRKVEMAVAIGQHQGSRVRLDVTREDDARRRQGAAGLQAMPLPRKHEIPRPRVDT